MGEFLERKIFKSSKRDPIDVFEEIFGEDLMNVKNLAEELVEIEKSKKFR